MSLRNVTITLDEETARWARIKAAERNTSVSKLVGEMLKREMQAADEYEDAMNDFFAIPPFLNMGPRESWPSREELHDRAALR